MADLNQLCDRYRHREDLSGVEVTFISNNEWTDEKFLQLIHNLTSILIYANQL
jgi:hypothetical protein